MVLNKFEYECAKVSIIIPILYSGHVYFSQPMPEEDERPSPVKFTNQNPPSEAIKPEAERPQQQEKQLSMENLRESLPDLTKEGDDDEVSD